MLHVCISYMNITQNNQLLIIIVYHNHSYHITGKTNTKYKYIVHLSWQRKMQKYVSDTIVNKPAAIRKKTSVTRKTTLIVTDMLDPSVDPFEIIRHEIVHLVPTMSYYLLALKILELGMAIEP